MPLEAKVLGQNVNYPTDYCPLILVPVPRRLNREKYDINDPEALFRGYQFLALETGRAMPEAIALYTKLGYREAPAWGPFTGDMLCLCMKKELFE